MFVIAASRERSISGDLGQRNFDSTARGFVDQHEAPVIARPKLGIGVEKLDAVDGSVRARSTLVAQPYRFHLYCGAS